jgi:serine/threonine protein kinase
MTALQYTEMQTLGSSLGGSRMAPEDALRYALEIATELQQLHESGSVHGSITPSAILIHDGRLELVPASDRPIRSAYTAPEWTPDAPADVRSDIFAFGAILFEMYTGHPFAKDPSQPRVSSGWRQLDHVIENCVAADPGKRYQHILKPKMELKLLNVSTRRTDALALARREDVLTTVRGEVGQVEERIARRQSEMYERTRSEILAATAARIQELNDHLDAQRRRSMDIERNVDGCVQAASDLKDLLLDEVESFSKSLTSQSSRIEATRNGIAETDLIVERVIDALEALQSLILDPQSKMPVLG